MGKIYITGHRNPDLDSLCSAISYAKLKNMTDPENEYIPIQCSPVSDTVRKQMDVMGIEVPVYKKDIRPKVSDVMLEPRNKVQTTQPIFDLIQRYSTDKPSVVPIYEGDDFKGLLSVDDITAWFLSDNKEEDRRYSFLVDNILKVLPAEVLHRGAAKDAEGSGGSDSGAAAGKQLATDLIEGTLLIGAANYEPFCESLNKHKDSIVILEARQEHIEYAVRMNVPAIIVTSGETPEIDFGGYEGVVVLTRLGTAEAIRRLRLAETVESMMASETVRIDSEALFVEAKSIFANSHTRGLAVMGGERGDDFVGYVTRRCLLDMPRHSVIMVDHNEPGQSIAGIEDANVVAIIDHHRLDAVSTSMPILIAAEPLGSTCTIVYQQFMKHGVMPDSYIAKVLLTGIVADTLILRSPTTTASDISTVEMLARLAKVASVEEFGEKLFSITANLAQQNPEDSILSDFKKYEQSGIRMGIGQCEVTTLGNVHDYAGAYIEALEMIRAREGLDWTLLMITDVLREQSVLLTTSFHGNRELPYKAVTDNMYSMPGVMSRKKQLLPALIAIAEK